LFLGFFLSRFTALSPQGNGFSPLSHSQWDIPSLMVRKLCGLSRLPLHHGKKFLINKGF
jgi:hypothetical protein